MPPNTTEQYDYHTNYNEVLSDIADWTPAGIGQKTLVSAHTWGDHPYPWPSGMAPPYQEDRNEAHWYIYWMQSMPGRGNTVPYGVNGMENWWKFTGNWDASIKAGVGLYASASKPVSISAARDAVRTLNGQVNTLAGTGVAGFANGGAAKLAPAVDGVLAEQMKRFRAYATSRPKT